MKITILNKKTKKIFNRIKMKNVNSYNVKKKLKWKKKKKMQIKINLVNQHWKMKFNKKKYKKI